MNVGRKCRQQYLKPNSIEGIRRYAADQRRFPLFWNLKMRKLFSFASYRTKLLLSPILSPFRGYFLGLRYFHCFDAWEIFLPLFAMQGVLDVDIVDGRSKLSPLPGEGPCWNGCRPRRLRWATGLLGPPSLVGCCLGSPDLVRLYLMVIMTHE